MGWVKLATALAVLVVLLVGGTGAPPPAPTRAPDADVAPVACAADGVSSPVGYRTGAATLALVRTPAGRLRVVPFARGWAVYTGHAPGTFVRVCAG